MSEILFRGKLIDTGDWIEGYYAKTTLTDEPLCLGDCRIHDLIIRDGTYYFIDRSTVGQFTGVIANNGKRVFEEDVIRWIDWRGNTKQAPVKFDPEWSRFCVWINGSESCGVNKHLSNDIEVIGNIHDNPDLLTKCAVHKDF